MSEETKETQEGTEEKVLDLGLINEKFGSSFEDEGSLKSAFDYYNSKEEHASKMKEFESTVSDLSEYKEKYTTFLENRDKFLPDTETLALKQLKEKYGDVDLGVLSQVRSTDLSSMNKLDALVMANKLEVKSSAPDSVRQKIILKQLGIEGSLSELEGDELQEAQFAIDNAYALKRKSLEEIRGFQPEVNGDFESDYKTLKEQREAEAKAKEAEAKSLKDHNTKMFKPLLDGFKEVSIPYEDGKGNELMAKYVVDEKFRTEFFNKGVEELTESGFKITPDNAQEVADYINNQFWIQNQRSIIREAVKQALSGEVEKDHNENHVNSSTNKTEAPPADSKALKTVREQLREGVLKTRK